MTLPEREEQIRAAHAEFIVFAVQACHTPELRPRFGELLDQLETLGQGTLAGAMRRILEGERDRALEAPLDADDRVIVTAVLRGLQDPASLPDPAAAARPAAAAPGLARMVHAAARGDAGALGILGEMAEQMEAVGGDMAAFGAVLRPLLQGERDPEVLCRRMGEKGQALVLQLLEELGRLENH